MDSMFVREYTVIHLVDSVNGYVGVPAFPACDFRYSGSRYTPEYLKDRMRADITLHARTYRVAYPGKELPVDPGVPPGWKGDAFRVRIDVRT